MFREGGNCLNIVSHFPPKSLAITRCGNVLHNARPITPLLALQRIQLHRLVSHEYIGHRDISESVLVCVFTPPYKVGTPPYIVGSPSCSKLQWKSSNFHAGKQRHNSSNPLLFWVIFESQSYRLYRLDIALTMVLSDLTNRSLSSTASPTVRRAAAGLRLSRNLLETAWVRAINPVREDGDEKTEEEEEVDFLFTLLLVSEELSPGGFAGRALAALETAERRASWSPPRLKDPSRRKFSEVIGLHLKKDPTMFKRYFRMPKECF